MEVILLFRLLIPMMLSGVESSSALGQCSSEEMRRTKINSLLTVRGCNDYACAMHTELGFTAELCSTEQMRRTAINNALADKGCSDYACAALKVLSDTGLIPSFNSSISFSQNIYNFTASENEFGEVLGVVVVKGRINETNNLIFGIEMVYPYDPGFSIVGNNNIVTLMAPRDYFDYEDTAYFNISITVGYINITGTIQDRAYIIVNLTDINDNVPHLSPLNISAELHENARNGDNITTVVAIDFDAGVGGQLIYNLSGNGAENFAFDSNGNLYVSRSEAIDFEASMSYVLIYQACDGGVPQLCSEPGYIFIQVINVDDLPPIFNPSSYQITISEGFGTDMLVFYINFSDPDTPFEDITLTLQPPQVHFQVVVLSGVGALMTTDVPLDRETLGMHAFSVVATDTAGATASASVLILLLDENDQRPFVDTHNIVVNFTEGGPPVYIANGLNIVDGDEVSLFPLTRVVASLHPSPSASAQSYPRPGGICDHANYSLLFDNNVHNLCGLQRCIYLLSVEEIVVPMQGSLIGGILELPRSQDLARNPVILLDGNQFESFTVTIWVRFTVQDSGNIFEAQSGNVNVFGMAVNTDGSLHIFVNPTPTTTTFLLTTGPLSTQDGQWHQLALKKVGRNLTMMFDCKIAQESVINTSVDTTFTRGDFTSANFFLGNRLSNGFYAEFYFCSSFASQSHICCTLTCGEHLNVASPTNDIEATVNFRTRSLELIYTGTDSNASLIQLQEAMRKIIYSNDLDEPHPLDRGLFFTVYDMIGQSDVQSVIVLHPDLINDQQPIIDLNGIAQPGIGFSTQFEETSAGTSIVGASAILYDLDSGYWPIGRVIVQLTGTIRALEFLDVVPGSTPLNISILSSSSRIEIFSGDPQVEYFPSDFINALKLIRYVDRTEEPTQFTRPISITVFDQGSTFVNDPLSFADVTIIPSNDMPVLDLNTADPSTQNISVVYEERAGRVLLLRGTTQSITDPDSTRASGATFAFTQRPNGEQEVLQIDSASLPHAASSLIYSFDLAAGWLILEGNYDFDTWLGIFRAVEYANNELNPSELDMHKIAVTIRDDGGVESRPAFICVTLSLFNNPPQIFLGGENIMDYSTIFTEDGDCVPVTSPNITLLDLDSAGIQLVRISLTGTTEPGDERLVITDPQPENAFNLPGSIIIVLQRNTPADYEVVLRRVVYCNIADEPDERSMRRVTFQATDTGLTTASGTTLGSSTSLASTTTIRIIRVNDQPELTFEPLNNISIRGVPTQIINPDTIFVEDSDSSLFNELLIYITNPQDNSSNEIIEFARQLPESIVSVGPLPANSGGILYRVTFEDPGADGNRVIETISDVRYNNRANRITVEPPRVICLTIMDFSITSEQACMTVTISPPNNFAPVFGPTSTSLTFLETDNPILIVSLTATDGDTGLEGTVKFSILQILSYTSGVPRFTTNNGIFAIDSDSTITAPNGLDAEEYNRHNITLVAADMGNPVRSAELQITIYVADVNDVAPMFRGVPYVAGSQREGLSPPRFVFLVSAVDLDVTSPNNNIQHYGLENYRDLFRIDTTGSITLITALDAEMQLEYLLNISAVDAGSPPQTGYTTVQFNLLDTNDNPAHIRQLTQAIYVIGDSPSSIGPAIRIEDNDLNLPAINQFSVSLTPSAIDASRTYDQCLVQCQEARIREAGLLPPAIDILALATFQQDQPEANGQVNFHQTRIGAAGCSAWELRRGTTAENDGYGRIPRGNLPDNFASGDFTLSFALAQTLEGYIIVVPDQTNPNLPTSSVDRSFAIWLRRYDFRFYYTYNGIINDDNPAVLRLNQGATIQEFFNPATPQTRHYTIIVKSSPAIVEVYVDCQHLGLLQLSGPVQSPSPNVDVFIGHGRPRPTNGGRLAGNISNFFYHPTAITPAQLLNFCSCGFEAIHLPPLPSSIMSTTEEETRLILEPYSGLIPINDALLVLRGITYENTFPSPTVNPDRELRFTIREETGIQRETIGAIKLVASDNNLPVIDLTGPSLAGIDYTTIFTEDTNPVLVAPDVRISRDIEDSVMPTFDRVMVHLMNPIDANETLIATSSSSYITIEISSNGQTVLITGPGIEADFVAVLQRVAYENTNDNPTVSPNRVISFTVVDTEGHVSNPMANTRVMLTAVNDPPQVSMGSVIGDVIDTVEFMEGSNGVLIAPNATVMDVDNAELFSATVRLQSPNLPTDALVYDNLSTPAISGEYNAMTGVLQLIGRALLADYNTVLSSIMFMSSDSPLLGSDGNPVVNPTRVVTVAVSDGELNSEMAQVTVQFIPVNTLPVITINSTTVEFRDGDMEVLIAPTIDIMDVDTQVLFSLRIILEGTLDEHQLSDGVRVSQALFFSSNTTAGFTNILREITYINFAPEPVLVPRFIDIEVCDSMSSCTQVQITIQIININDNPPVFATPEYTLPATEDVPIGFTVGSLTVNDRDQMTQTLTFSMDGSDPFELRPDGNTVHVVTTQLLDFETTNVYMFIVTVSDGVNLGFANVTVDVLDVNEQPVIVLDPPAPLIVVDPESESQLILVNIMISDPDIGDSVDRAQLILDNVPEGSNETLGWNEISGYSFVRTSENVFVLIRLSSSVPLAEGLQSIDYIVGLIVTDLTEIRHIAITVQDQAGLSSDEAAINVSLASIPQFTTGVYTVSLMEEVIHRDFLQVQASVENGGEVIEYSVDSGNNVIIDSLTGCLSLDRPLDHEVERFLSFSIYAIDALPPARTGTATVNITVMDINDVRPTIGDINNITISTGVAINPFLSITISDPDTVGLIIRASVAIAGDSIVPSPFSGRICVDEYNVITKMTDVCGLPVRSFIDLAANIGSRENVGIMADRYSNRILNNIPDAGYSVISADFNSFQGPISEFTFTVWLAPSTSGYVAYFGTPDATERYFAVYYDNSDNQLIVTLKRSGLSGLSAQVRVNFQLQPSLSDGNFHFITIQYVQRNLVCVVDGVPVRSFAVIYKAQSFIGKSLVFH